MLGDPESASLRHFCDPLLRGGGVKSRGSHLLASSGRRRPAGSARHAPTARRKSGAPAGIRSGSCRDRPDPPARAPTRRRCAARVSRAHWTRARFHRPCLRPRRPARHRRGPRRPPLRRRRRLRECPESIRHFLEIRGIGIIDINNLYGVGAIKRYTFIDMVVLLEQWNNEKEYDRIGIDEYYTEILGIKLP